MTETSESDGLTLQVDDQLFDEIGNPDEVAAKDDARERDARGKEKTFVHVVARPASKCASKMCYDLIPSPFADHVGWCSRALRYLMSRRNAHVFSKTVKIRNGHSHYLQKKVFVIIVTSRSGRRHLFLQAARYCHSRSTTKRPPPPMRTSQFPVQRTTQVPWWRRTTSAPSWGSTNAPTQCGPRVRRDWEDLTAREQTLYLTGFRQLRVSGKLEYFTKEHIEAARSGFDSLTFHGNNGFLPWHRYFIWELEEQIRKLGGAYRCFTLPYWDWTRGAGQTVANNPLWDTTIIGGNGASCVTQGLVSQSSGYVISAVNGGGCLRRTFRSGTNFYQTTAQSMQMVETAQTFVSFRGQLEGRHNLAHVSVGGHLTSTLTATDDPVFYMLHSYVDMLWALRSDCHNYNQVNNPNDNNIYPTNEMSAHMSYPELRNASWAYISSNSISVSSLLRTTRAPWRYTYSGSNMRVRSGMAMSGCTWNEIPTEPASEVLSKAVRPDGLGRIAHLVNLEVQRKKAEEDKMSDNQIAAYACKRMQELKVKLGYKGDVCKYTARLEKCGPGPERVNIPLSVILNKRGIEGNACLKKARKMVYAFAKETGTLRGLCNGLMDPVCPGSGNGAMFDEKFQRTS